MKQNCVAVFGVGLIGGSFALAVRAAGIANRVVGIDSNRIAADRAWALGLVDAVTDDVEQAAHEADFFFVAAPVAQTGSILASLAPHLDPDSVVTDAGSTKGDVVTAARRVLGAKLGQFVPGHPIAGREQHGPDAALPELFRDRRVILTPIFENPAETVARVRGIWQALGARVSTLDVAQHDKVLAAVSHLPHMLAYALVAHLADSPDALLKFELAGAGFGDFTRIAASSPEMWRDIALANREALIEELDRYASALSHLRSLVAGADGAALEELFRRASTRRMQWPLDRSR